METLIRSNSIDVIILDSVAALTTKLAALEAANGTQLVVVTLPDLQGYEISDFGYQLGRAWGIGSKEKNDGALLIIAPKERKLRIEVGSHGAVLQPHGEQRAVEHVE